MDKNHISNNHMSNSSNTSGKKSLMWHVHAISAMSKLKRTHSVVAHSIVSESEK